MDEVKANIIANLPSGVEASEFPRGRQRLMHMGAELQGSETVSHCGIHDGSRLHLILLPPKRIQITVTVFGPQPLLTSATPAPAPGTDEQLPSQQGPNQQEDAQARGLPPCSTAPCHGARVGPPAPLPLLCI